MAADGRWGGIGSVRDVYRSVVLVSKSQVRRIDGNHMIETDLWPRIEPLLLEVERPSRYIGSEWGSRRKSDARADLVMIYPDTYELGQANQAMRILVNAVNAADGLAAERAYLPAADMIDVMREHGIPMFSLESCAPVKEFDVVGITLPHELAATNVLEVLDLSGITLRAEQRSEDEPIVIAGGPCVLDPEPYAPFFDAILIGEGEQSVPEVLALVARLKEEGAPREEILFELSRIDGTYVPSLYDLLSEDEAQRSGAWAVPKDLGREDGGRAPDKVYKRIFEGFSTSDAWEPMIVPFTEAVHDRLNVEILRGCARGCRFCQAGMMYRPVRERSAEGIIDAVKRGIEETGYEEVSLTSLSSTDHSQIERILTELNREFEGKGVRVSIPSQRLDSFGVHMAELVAGGKKGGLTFAPEAGTQRLRDVINKNVTEDDLFASIDAACKAGWRRVKLYFMIGLPTETDEDIKGIASLAQRAYDRMKAATPPEQRGSLRMVVSAAVFVPKSQTPFQWDGQIDPEEAIRRATLLKHSVKYKAVQVNYHDPKTSLIEAVMSRGGRDIADLLESAWERGARFDAWSEHFNEQAWSDAAKECGIDMRELAQRTYSTDRIMQWEHISCGVDRSYLADERKRAQDGVITVDCTYDGCTMCGVCPDLGTNNEIAGARGASKAVPVLDEEADRDE